MSRDDQSPLYYTRKVLMALNHSASQQSLAMAAGDGLPTSRRRGRKGGRKHSRKGKRY